MTLKKQMEIANEIIEKIEAVMPGDYYAQPEANDLVRIMGRTAEGVLDVYISIDGVIEMAAQKILDMSVKERT